MLFQLNRPDLGKGFPLSVRKMNFKLMETCGENTCCEFGDGHQDTRKLAISRQEIVGDKMQQLKNRTKTRKSSGEKGIIDKYKTKH